MVMSPVNGSSAFERRTASDNQTAEGCQHSPVSRVVGLRNVSPALQFGFHQCRHLAGRKIPLDGLEALQHAAKQRDLQLTEASEQTGRQLAVQRVVNNHAAPLSPLRERDTVALSEWFEQADMDQIEADIARCLIVLWPTPCWEEDPFKFLEGYIEQDNLRSPGLVKCQF
jgi:hypothetical protein